MATKRIVVISDLHCGHRVGLTPPEWWWRDDTPLQAKIHKNQKELWTWYAKSIQKLRPIDILVVNGDAIDGKGLRSGGAEQTTADRHIQCDMAARCIIEAAPQKTVLIYGTPYHTGTEEDWEAVVAAKIAGDVTIESHAFLDVNGKLFDIKHHIGGSQVPHGRYTALAREKLWNTVWHNRDEQQPKAGILIRSHVHYCAFCGSPEWLALTTPALQGYGSLYGVRRCSGTVDIGITYFDVGKGSFTWNVNTARLSQQFVKTLKL